MGFKLRRDWVLYPLLGKSDAELAKMYVEEINEKLTTMDIQLKRKEQLAQERAEKDKCTKELQEKVYGILDANYKPKDFEQMGSNTEVGDKLIAIFADFYSKDKEWVSVEDGLPTGDCNVLALCGKTSYVLWFSGEKFYMSFHIRQYFEDWTKEVTHWQPLPKAPKTEEG